MRDRVRFLLQGGLLLSALAAAPGAAADAPPPPRVSATQLLKDGLEELERKRYDQACLLLEKSLAAPDGHRGETLFHLARCEEERGNIATAAAHYDDYFILVAAISQAEQRVELQRQQEAARRRQRLDPDIPTITLVLPSSAPEGTLVTRMRRGGESVTLAVGVPLPVDPGNHVISAQAPGGARSDHPFSIKKGEKNKPVKLTVLPADRGAVGRYGTPVAPVASSLPPLDPGISAWRVSAYTIGAVGIAGLLLGAITGAITWGQKGVISANCNEAMPRTCNEQGQSAADLARTLGLVSTVSFIAGGVLTATGIILFVTEPSPPRLSGRWQRPTVRIGGLATGGASMEVGWQW